MSALLHYLPPLIVAGVAAATAWALTRKSCEALEELWKDWP